jgi:hypothetical protein
MTVDLSEFRKTRPVKKCGVGKFLDGLSPGEAEKLEAALAEPTIPTASILEWCTERGAPYQYNTLSIHRRGICPCVRI